MNRRVIAWTILAAWFGSLSWLILREREEALDPFSDDVSLLPVVTQFYSLRSGKAQVGIASVALDTTADGFRLTERTGIDVARGADSGRASSLATYELTGDLRLRSYRITIPTPGRYFSIEGKVEGDSLLRVLAGDSITGERWTIPLSGRPVPEAAAMLWLAASGGLQPGLEKAIPVFNPVRLMLDTVHFSTGKEHKVAEVDSAEFDDDDGRWRPAMVDSLRVWEVRPPGREGVTLVDRYGLTVRSHFPSGLTWSRGPFEIVNINYRLNQNRRPVILSDQAVVPTTALASGADAKGYRRGHLVVKFSPGPSGSAGAGMTTSRQTWERPYLTVRADSLPGKAALPDSAALDTLAIWLRDEPWIQTSDSLVQAMADRAAGRRGNATAVARRLNSWVHGRVAAAASGPVSARRALESGRGDADASALALTALARASGIPARPVSGLLLADGRFYLHSWVELYLDGWLEVDPALGQFPVDARHIRLMTDGRARFDVMKDQVAGLRLAIPSTPGPT